MVKGRQISTNWITATDCRDVVDTTREFLIARVSDTPPIPFDQMPRHYRYEGKIDHLLDPLKNVPPQMWIRNATFYPHQSKEQHTRARIVGFVNESRNAGQIISQRTKVYDPTGNAIPAVNNRGGILIADISELSAIHNIPKDVRRLMLEIASAGPNGEMRALWIIANYIPVALQHTVLTECTEHMLTHKDKYLIMSPEQERVSTRSELHEC